MMIHRLSAALAIVLIAFWAAADTITVGDTTYTDVYIGQGSTMYYVSIPEDGTVLNVPIKEASGVEITEDQEVRSVLFREWQKNNLERRGLPQPAPKVAEISETPYAATGSKESEKKSKKPEPAVRVRRHRSAPAYSGSSNSYSSYDQAAYQQQLFEMQRNAQIAKLRRQKEAQKNQRLRNVRVITSQDVAGSGGRMGGGYGGSYGGGIRGRR